MILELYATCGSLVYALAFPSMRTFDVGVIVVCYRGGVDRTSGRSAGGRARFIDADGKFRKTGRRAAGTCWRRYIDCSDVAAIRRALSLFRCRELGERQDT
jgi:hypothetical protein